MYNNTGKWERNYVFFNKIMFGFNMCEDPSLPWWKRRWGWEQHGVKNEMSIAIVQSKQDDVKATFIYVFPFQFAIAFF